METHKFNIRNTETTTREDWEKAFKQMAENGDDELLGKEEIQRPSEWDEEEWTW
ncbi:MAG: hypothetical protein WEA36_00660 [Balneolaceae bacterium]